MSAAKRGWPVGLYCHLLDAQGAIQHQGQVKAIDGEFAIIELFDWGFGMACEVVAVQRMHLYAKAHVRLYACSESMRAAWDNSPQGRAIRSPR